MTKISHLSSEKITIIAIFVIAFSLPTIFFFVYRNYVNKQIQEIKSEQSFQYPEKSQIAAKTETTQPKNISPDCIFKEIQELSPTEISFVLSSAEKKVIRVLQQKESFLSCWMVLYAEPMSNTELEMLGDVLLDKIRKKFSNSTVLKMSVYWNEEIANKCMNANYSGQSQFYNSSWDTGSKAKTGLHEAPRSLDETGLFVAASKDDICFLFCTLIEYDDKTKVLTLETTVKCMLELIFNTFSGLGKNTAGCWFDRMPELKKIKIIYKDVKGNQIGEALYDIEYWCRMIQVDMAPEFIRDQESEEYLDIQLRYNSKLLSEKEFYEKNDEIRRRYGEIESDCYEKAWIKLFPLIEGFQLTIELPRRHESFKF